MRWWLFSLVGIFSYLFFMLADLPAQQALYWLASDDFPIVTDGISGTLWNGNARRTSYNHIELGASAWKFKPLSLLIGQIEYEVDLSGKNQELSGHTALNILTGGYILTDLKGSMETANIPTLIGKPYVQVDGKLDIDIQQIQISRQQVSAVLGSLLWNDAMLLKPIKSKLGSLQFNLSSDDQMLKTNIKNIAGPFQVDGVVELQPDGTYRIHGKVKQTGTTDPGLISLLNNIGRPLADGSTQIDYSGQL